MAGASPRSPRKTTRSLQRPYLETVAGLRVTGTPCVGIPVARPEEPRLRPQELLEAGGFFMARYRIGLIVCVASMSALAWALPAGAHQNAHRARPG